jgi:hypothetical protein
LVLLWVEMVAGSLLPIHCFAVQEKVRKLSLLLHPHMQHTKHSKLNLSWILVKLLLWGSIHFANGQIRHPLISPAIKTQQGIGLSEVTLSYHRPAARGRKIFGSLVPYGRIWRLGANESTKITFSDPVQILDQELARGTYAFYVIPYPDQWIVIFHNNLKHWGDGRNNYRPEEDALRVTIIPDTNAVFVEDFTIGFEHISFDTAQLVITWENTRASIPLTFNTRAIMLEEINRQIKNNPTADTYYQSGRYLQESGIQYEQARSYLVKANELAPDKYYIHRVWALVEAGLGNYSKAIELARQSAFLATREGKDEFVRMNERSVEDWKKLVRP